MANCSQQNTLTMDSIASCKSLTSLSISTKYPINISDTLQYEIISEETYITINQFISTATLIVAVCGVVLNTLNIKTFSLMGLKDGVTVTFLTLAISDFCANSLTFIQSTARLFISIEDKNNLWFSIDPVVVDLFTNVLANLFTTATALTTAFIAFARCMCVASPFKFRNMFTRKRCLIAFFLILFIDTAFVTPFLANMGTEFKFDPKRNMSRTVIWFSKDREKVKDIVASFNFLTVSLSTEIIIVICVMVIIFKLRQSVSFRQNEGKSIDVSTADKESVKLSGKERSVAFQVVTISIVFILCNIIKVVHALLMNLHPKYEVRQPFHYLYMTMGSLRNLSDCINSTVNFFVYLVFNSKFRSLVFTCKKKD